MHIKVFKLTPHIGIAMPIEYSNSFPTVDSLNGWLIDSSLQKNPRLYGTPNLRQ